MRSRGPQGFTNSYILPFAANRVNAPDPAPKRKFGRLPANSAASGRVPHDLAFSKRRSPGNSLDPTAEGEKHRLLGRCLENGRARCGRCRAPATAAACAANAYSARGVGGRDSPCRKPRPRVGPARGSKRLFEAVWTLDGPRPQSGQDAARSGLASSNMLAPVIAGRSNPRTGAPSRFPSARNR